MFETWQNSRDSTSNPGSSGIDKVSALHFAAKLDANLTNIAKQIKTGNFGFAPLRAIFIPKPNSKKDRMICIPTVEDRLVQRTIAEYITKKKILPIYNSSSFGFMEGRGVSKAITAVIALRHRYDWCLKTDIESFFDRVPRDYLKQKVRQSLKKSNLAPLICKAIDCEAKVAPRDKNKFDKQGLKRGQGIRQGMPLSPILANLTLAEFDKRVADAGIEMVRYADDIVLFCVTYSDAKAAEKFIRDELQAIQLTIPEIADNSKTVLVSKSDPLTFLGREIVYLASENAFIARISQKQIEKIKARLLEDFSFEKRLKDGKNFQETLVDLSRSISSYLGIYRDAYNYRSFADDLRGEARRIITKIFRDIFGPKSLDSLNGESKKFLGLDGFDLAPNSELDV